MFCLKYLGKGGSEFLKKVADITTANIIELYEDKEEVEVAVHEEGGGVNKVRIILCDISTCASCFIITWFLFYVDHSYKPYHYYLPLYLGAPHFNDISRRIGDTFHGFCDKFYVWGDILRVNFVQFQAQLNIYI